MAIGAQVNKLLIDARLASAVTSLRDQFVNAQRINKWLQAQEDANLIAEFGYTAAEVARAKSAFLALDKLAKVAYGQETQAAADNFFYFPDQLVGLD